MARAKIVLTLILVAIAVFSTIAYSSAAQTFWFSRDLTVNELNAGNYSYYEPVFNFNLTDSGKYLGTLYFRMEAVYLNQSSNTDMWIFSIWVTLN